MAQNRVWHIAIDGERFGPFTEDEVRTRIRSGTVDLNTHVFRTGRSGWQSITRQSEFAQDVAKYAIPPPPPNTRSQHVQAQTYRRESKTSIGQGIGKLFFRLVIAGLLGFGAYFVVLNLTDNTQNAMIVAAIAGALGLLLGSSPMAWIGTILGAGGLYFAFHTYELKPVCLFLYRSDAEFHNPTEILTHYCYHDFNECSQQIGQLSGLYRKRGKLSCTDRCAHQVGPASFANFGSNECKLNLILEDLFKDEYH